MIEQEIYDIVKFIHNHIKTETFKRISIKNTLIDIGNKSKWKCGNEYTFICDDVSFICNHFTYHKDLDKYELTEIYGVSKLKNLSKTDLLTFLISKKRIINIDKLLRLN